MKARFWLDENEFENYQFSLLGEKYWLRLDRQRHFRILRVKRFSVKGYSWRQIFEAVPPFLPSITKGPFVRPLPGFFGASR
jgi:hypothetical protein